MNENSSCPETWSLCDDGSCRRKSGAFHKMHRDVVRELATGPLEQDTVATLARLLWRKQNLITIRNAELARRHYAEIRSAKVPGSFPVLRMLVIDPAKHEEAVRAAENEARQELGDAYELVQIGATQQLSVGEDLASKNDWTA
jgi:hypothetical protein